MMNKTHRTHLVIAPLALAVAVGAGAASGGVLPDDTHWGVALPMGDTRGSSTPIIDDTHGVSVLEDTHW